jgi:hypothetical protein
LTVADDPPSLAPATASDGPGVTIGAGSSPKGCVMAVAASRHIGRHTSTKRVELSAELMSTTESATAFGSIDAI